MLKTQDFIERLDLIDREKYKHMVSLVNIPDFYKCIAQFSGLPISKVSDDVIFTYLKEWCQNKYRFYQMLGNKLRLDQPFEYERTDNNIADGLTDLGKQYPTYYFWFQHFRDCKKNKIDDDRFIGWQLRDVLPKLFPQFNLVGSTLTHFFKSKLNAPDELVTALGRLFENDKVAATHTISIDPVDMMLASENPYGWNSCYRLEINRSDSHADGCLAAILDTSSLITYVWEREGEYNLYDTFKFKKIRYYRMRGWIAIAEDFGGIHFNSVYPGRSSYDEAFNKQLREVVEEVVAKYIKVENKWKKNEYHSVRKNGFDYHVPVYRCFREFLYGYNEYDDNAVYINTEINKLPIANIEEGTQEDIDTKAIKVYDNKIVCACGCGIELLGSDECYDEDDCEEDCTCYNGEGFNCCNYYKYEPELKWCPYKDCECTSNCREWEDCWEECETYIDNHPKCGLKDYYECESPDWDNIEDGVVIACEKNCVGCWVWRQHHPEEEGEE